jgi:hypothetical protein
MRSRPGHAGRAVVAALVVFLLLAGCTGDDDGTTATTGATETAPAPTPTPTPTTAAGGGQAGGGTSPGSCDGSIGAETVENVEVPAGATCTLEGTTVTGNVRVRRDATLDARRVRVDGDVQGENARAVNVTMSSSVDGNIQVEQGGSSNVTRIDGDLQWESQRGRMVADGNVIGGNLQAESNRGGLAITGNRIDGNLQCQSNTPAPTGGGNRVEGDKEGQCARL